MGTGDSQQRQVGMEAWLPTTSQSLWAYRKVMNEEKSSHMSTNILRPSTSTITLVGRVISHTNQDLQYSPCCPSKMAERTPDVPSYLPVSPHSCVLCWDANVSGPLFPNDDGQKDTLRGTLGSHGPHFGKKIPDRKPAEQTATQHACVIRA